VANSRPTQGRSSSSLARTQRTQHFTKAGTRELSLTLPFRITSILRIIPDSTNTSCVLRYNPSNAVLN
jgi:hypothetical protein